MMLAHEARLPSDLPLALYSPAVCRQATDVGKPSRGSSCGILSLCYRTGPGYLPAKPRKSVHLVLCQAKERTHLVA